MMHEPSELTQPTRYQAYLVRLWREDEHTAWRITVRHVLSGEQHQFNNLSEYIAFLQRRMDLFEDLQ